MNVAELYDLIVWLDQEIIASQIVQKYQSLQTILQQNIQPNQPRQPFENQKETLVTALLKVNLQRLTMEQLDFLAKLHIAQYVGKDGVAYLEDIFYKNAIDIATAGQKVSSIIQEMSNGINRSNQIKGGLSGYVEVEKIEEDNVLIRVYFTHKASMVNITDFKKWGNIWYEIGRGIAMLHDSAPESIRIIGAYKGSIIIELAVLYGIAQTTSKIILMALQVADRALEIKKKAEELRGMRLANDKIARDLDKEAENEKKLGIEEISRKVIEEIGKSLENEGDKVPAFEKSVKNLVDFLEQGGEVDCIVPETQEGEGETAEAEERRDKIKQLRSSFEEIRLLEAKLRQIEL